jgi:hypothetical protein
MAIARAISPAASESSLAWLIKIRISQSPSPLVAGFWPLRALNWNATSLLRRQQFGLANRLSRTTTDSAGYFAGRARSDRRRCRQPGAGVVGQATAIRRVHELDASAAQDHRRKVRSSWAPKSSVLPEYIVALLGQIRTERVALEPNHNMARRVGANPLRLREFRRSPGRSTTARATLGTAMLARL